jgi:predicted GNAT family N-acyltransferase
LRRSPALSPGGTGTVTHSTSSACPDLSTRRGATFVLDAVWNRHAARRRRATDDRRRPKDRHSTYRDGSRAGSWKLGRALVRPRAMAVRPPLTIEPIAASYSVGVVSWELARVAATRIREAVFVSEQGVPAEVQPDVRDVAAIALSRRTVRCDRRNRPPLPDGHIGRMAALPQCRAHGVAAPCSRRWARARGFAVVTLEAQTHATGVYSRFDFREHGTVFILDGIPHVMWLPARRPGERSIPKHDTQRH